MARLSWRPYRAGGRVCRIKFNLTTCPTLTLLGHAGWFVRLGFGFVNLNIGMGMDAQESSEEGVAFNTVGDRLRHAREAAGKSRADISAATRVAERHLLAIEENRFADLAARTYAVGFSRAYARAVNLNEAEIAEQVRAHLDAEDAGRPRPTLPSFEPGDPARVPPWGLAAAAAMGFVVVAVALYLLWGNLFSPEGELPDLLSDKPAEVAPAPKKFVASAPVGAPGGPVVLTATAPNVWLKVYLADGTQLLQRELAQGESYTVPVDARGPLLRTGRPDVLAITVGGRALPRLADKPMTMGDISLAPADLIARATPAPVAQTTGQPVVTGSAAQSPASPPVARPTPRAAASSANPPSVQTAPPLPARVPTSPSPSAPASPQGGVSTELP